MTAVVLIILLGLPPDGDIFLVVVCQGWLATVATGGSKTRPDAITHGRCCSVEIRIIIARLFIFVASTISVFSENELLNE